MKHHRNSWITQLAEAKPFIPILSYSHNKLNHNFFLAPPCAHTNSVQKKRGERPRASYEYKRNNQNFIQQIIIQHHTESIERRNQAHTHTPTSRLSHSHTN